MILNRQMKEEELNGILKWAAAEGWNPGLEDAVAFWAADPEGFFVAEDGGAPVAAISVVNHTAEFAFLGLYLCLPAYRAKGIGFGLWKHALAHPGARCIGLDGVPEQEENYERSGFVRTGGTTRFTGVLPGGRGAGVREALPEDIQALVALEGQASGVCKSRYLKAWLAEAKTRTPLVLGKAEHIEGFAVIRACESGFKVGPLVAHYAETAERLLAAVAVETEDAPVSIDIPEESSALRAIAQANGLKAGFATARMYKGTPPEGGDLVYAVASMELG